MLTTSSVLYILQYVLLLQRSNQATTIAKQIRSMQEMQADLQYAHQMLDKWQLYGVSPNDTFTFVSLVSAVNIYLNSLTLTNEIPIMYSDMSNQTILLSFALNKWVSEAGAVSTSTSVTLPSDSHVFYLGYNTVNAINLGCSWAVEALQQSFVSLISGTLTFNIVYLGVVGSVFLVLLLGKNVILNLVLKKKAEILNIFFVIPRAACNSIQKECERFIQKLSVEDDNAEMDSCGSDDEEKQIAKDKRGKQKKRTIMGEEKTANNFVLATAAFLAVILAYHIFMLANALAKRDTLDYVYSASFDIFAYERDTAMTVSFMVLIC